MSDYVRDSPDGCGYVEGSETSRDAAKAAEEFAPNMCTQVVELVREFGRDGLLARDIELLKGWLISSTSARVSDCKFAGTIIETARKRATPKNKPTSKDSFAYVFVTPEFATDEELAASVLWRKTEAENRREKAEYKAAKKAREAAAAKASE